jgi:hypothetical protein
MTQALAVLLGILGSAYALSEGNRPAALWAAAYTVAACSW